MRSEQPRRTDETVDEFNEWNREHNNNENEIAEEEFNSKKAKDAARQRRILVRRKEFDRRIGEIREAGDNVIALTDNASAEFFGRQGEDLIQDEELLEEWRQKVVCPDEEGWTFKVGTISAAVKAMEILESREALVLSEEEALRVAGELVKKENKWSYTPITTARLVAKFSKDGKKFAEYAGISDLNDNDPEGYWDIEKNPDGSLRELHFDIRKLPEDRRYIV